MVKRYGDNAHKEIEKTIHEYKNGDLTIGNSKEKVKSKKQAVAIGISNARKKHYKVPYRIVK